jgi:hypothetical protein
MKIFSFDNNIKSNRVKRESDTNLFDLFKKNIVNDTTIVLLYYIVPREYEMRLDRISEHIYGTSEYVEELMIINDIINPYSIKEGQYIYYCNTNDLEKLYTTDDLSTIENENEKRKRVIESNKSKKDKKDDGHLPLTIKPSNLKQITVSDDNYVQIINSFE